MVLAKSKEEIELLHQKMNSRAKTKRRTKTTLLVLGNVVMALVILLPLLYAISIAFMPSSELFTLDMNLLPKNPTLQNFKEALTKVPLVRFVLNSFLVAGLITLGTDYFLSLPHLHFHSWNLKVKEFCLWLVMATMMVPGEATIISNYFSGS